MKDINHKDNILRTFILFMQAGEAAMKFANAKFWEKERLSTIKFMVLQILSTNGHVMKPSELARWTMRKPSNLTMILSSLEKDGFVKSERSVKDKRVVHITLTDQGERVLTKAKETARMIVKDTMASIHQEDLPILEKSLRTLIDNSCHGT